MGWIIISFSIHLRKHIFNILRPEFFFIFRLTDQPTPSFPKIPPKITIVFNPLGGGGVSRNRKPPHIPRILGAVF